jgi:hypothetical protein
MATNNHKPELEKKSLPVLGEKNTEYVPPWETQAQKVKDTKEAQLIRAEKKAKNHQKFVRAKWRNRGIFASIIFLIIWFYNPHGIFVLGDPLSVGRYRAVLKDLKKQMPQEHQMVKDHIDQIRISYFIPGGDYAGLAQEKNDGSKSITLLENTFIQGPGYAHSVLVHEACHGLQFEKELPFASFCDRQSREHACNQMGLKVLYEFEAKPEMIEHYESIAIGKTVYGNSCMRNGTLQAMPEI